MRIVAGLLAAAALMSGAPAMAQITSEEPGRVLNLGGTKLTGEIEKPDVFIFVTPKQAKFKSLIKVRKDFTPELERSLAKL